MTLTGTEAFVAGAGYVEVFNPHDGSLMMSFPEWYWRIVYQKRPAPRYTDEWLSAELEKLDKRIPVEENAGNTAA